MPAAVVDPKPSLDSEQISPATIAHHTVYENVKNGKRGACEQKAATVLPNRTAAA